MRTVGYVPEAPKKTRRNVESADKADEAPKKTKGKAKDKDEAKDENADKADE